jgi:hypothetical protein
MLGHSKPPRDRRKRQVVNALFAQDLLSRLQNVQPHLLAFLAYSKRARSMARCLRRHLDSFFNVVQLF